MSKESQMFDVDSFLEQSYEGENSTQVNPVPEDDWLAVIDGVKARTWQSKSDPSKAGIALDVTWILQESPDLPEEFHGRKVKQGIMLDTTADGRLDMSKGANVQLGRLRAAVGLNTPGESFAFHQLPGNLALIRIKHRYPDEQPDPENPIVYTDVAGVAKPS